MHLTPARLGLTGALCVLILACSGDYAVRVSDGTVSVSREFWKPMQNPEPFADNFEARSKQTGEEYEQVLTVYKSPMRADQKGDLELSPTVWIDAMVVHPPAVTIQVRVAHRGHWALSRQTFSARPGVDAAALGPFLKPEQVRALAAVYEDQILRTRSTLESLSAF